MPFHIFLAQSLSLVTGGLEVWKVAKDVVLAIATLFAICLVFRTGKTTHTFKLLVAISTLYGLFHAVIWALHPDIYTQSALLGSTYNLRLPCFLLLGYSATLLIDDIDYRRVLKFTLIVSAIVAILGIAQYFLPQDVLTHVGYGVDRGVKPSFAIDDNPAFPRIMSTLRDPNSLGSFLLVPLAIATFYGLETSILKKRAKCVALAVLYLVALYLTFSRSAWASSILVVALVAWHRYQQILFVIVRRFWPIVIAMVLLVGVSGYMLRSSKQINGVVSHTTDKQVGQYDSNEYHYLFVKQGIEGIIAKPLGHGPGTAGLASIQNPKGSFLTENYYVQIGYEVGIAGLLVFIALNVVVYMQLWHRRNNALAVVLLTTFWAYVLINMLLHIWSNEAVACQWWLLAGIALGMPLAKSAGNTKKSAHKI